MSLNDNVRAAILRVSEGSKVARQIAARLGLTEGASVTASDVVDVEALKAQVELLTNQLAELRLILSSSEEEEDESLSEAQRAKFIQNFKDSLGTQSFAVIADVYDAEYFEGFSPKLRYELSIVLVNWCQERKFKPAELWYNMMVNNGSL